MQNEPNRVEQLWNVQDVAGYLKVSRSWVYHHAESGEVPCLKIGGLVRFDPQAIHAFARGESTHGGRVVQFRRK